MTALEWDTVLRPSKAPFRLRGTSRSGGRSITGAEQVIQHYGAYWQAALTIPIRSADQRLALDAVLDRGRAATYLIGPYTYREAPWPTDVWGRKIGPKMQRRPQLDGTPFADDPELADDLINVAVADDALMGATTIQLSVITDTSTPRVGNAIGMRDRLYRITGITSSFGNLHTVTILPPLREQAYQADDVTFVQPKTSMRLASDDAGADLDLDRFGIVTLEFVEAL